MKTTQVAFTAMALVTLALNNTGCMTHQDTINEPAGASAVYRNGEWKEIDTSDYRQIREQDRGYYDGTGRWHPGSPH